MVLSSCDSCKDKCTEGPLEFDLPLQAYGIKDTLNIGGTIRIRLAILDQLPERSSGYLYDFMNYNFQLTTYMARLDTLPIGTDSKETFNWTTVEGESKYSGGLFVVSPNYSNNTYQYEILITPKKKGLFEFGMSSSFDRYFPLAKLDGPCTKHPVAVYPKLENEKRLIRSLRPLLNKEK